MIAALITLASLMGLILAFRMFGGIGIMGAVSGVLALALMIIAIVLPAASLARFARVLQPVLILVLAAPVLWMLLLQRCRRAHWLTRSGRAPQLP